MLFIAQLILDSMGDALNSKIRFNTSKNSILNKKSHIVQAFQILIWLIIVGLVFTGYILAYNINASSYPLDKLIWFLKLLLGYSVLRFAIFDYLFNAFAGNTRSYYGKSSYYDIIINSTIVFFNKIAPKMPLSFISWIFFVIRFVLFFESYKIITNLIK